MDWNSLVRSNRRLSIFCQQGLIALVILVLMSLSISVGSVQAACTTGPGIERVSISAYGTQANGPSGTFPPAISNDGRYVAFVSAATNLVDADTNGVDDVFVRDRFLCTTLLVSRANSAEQGNQNSNAPSMSSDGRYIAFVSSSNNLVVGESTDFYDRVFMHDLQTGETTLVSVASDGTEANGSSGYPSVSGDGRYVAFVSYATNLVSDDTNNTADVFVHDTQTGTTVRASVASDGSQANDGANYVAPHLSSNGRYVVFTSIATNLVSSAPGAGDQVYKHDLQTGKTTEESLSSNGVPGNDDSFAPFVSDDGNQVLFSSYSNNLAGTDEYQFADIYLRDHPSDETTMLPLVPPGTARYGDLNLDGLSADGRMVLLWTYVWHLVSDDNDANGDVFVYYRYYHQTRRLSVPANGTTANNMSDNAGISPNGSFVAFQSLASNLVSGDTNQVSDVFLVEVNAPTVPIGAPALNYFTDQQATLTWNQTFRAIGYQVQVDTDTGFRSPMTLDKQVGADALFLQTPVLPYGTYYWRVRAQLGVNRWSAWSTVERFEVAPP